MEWQVTLEGAGVNPYGSEAPRGCPVHLIPKTRRTCHENDPSTFRSGHHVSCVTLLMSHTSRQQAELNAVEYYSDSVHNTWHSFWNGRQGGRGAGRSYSHGSEAPALGIPVQQRKLTKHFEDFLKNRASKNVSPRKCMHSMISP